VTTEGMSRNDYVSLDDEGRATPLRDSFSDDAFAFADEDRGPVGHGAGRARGMSSGADRAAQRARELSASLQEGASRFFKSTKDWLSEKNASRGRNAADGHHQTNQQQQQQRRRREFARFEDEEEIDPALLLVQKNIPTCQGEWVGDGPIEARSLYRSIEVYVPPEMQPGSELVVALPTGEARLVSVPHGMQNGGEKVAIVYKGYIPEEFGIECVDSEQEEMGRELRQDPDERLVELYRKHNPTERDALLQKHENGFGIEVFDGRYGVHVHHATFVGVPTMLAADDIIVSVNEKAVMCKQEFDEILNELQIGDYISLGVLRKSPPPVQRCPQGHPLREVGPRDPIPIGSECNRCSKRLFNVAVVHRCSECDWAFCDDCYKKGFEKMNSAENANNGDPEWAKDYEESYEGQLQFSYADRGKKLRIFWHTTQEWWLGEVLSYDPSRGHEVLYEEGTGENKRKSKQSIADISLFTYRLMKPRERREAEEETKEHVLQRDDDDDNENEGDESFHLDESEKDLLESIEADLGKEVENDLLM